MEKNLSEKQVLYLKNIEDSGQRMLGMINLSLDLFKMERGIYRLQPVSVDILKIIKKIIDEMKNLAKSWGIDIHLLVNGKPANDADVFLALGEELLCYSMLANLIKNAVEASPEESDVTVMLENEEELIISIHNLGAVPMDIQDSFFEKYVTSGKDSGTGLGTYSARLIAETQGGNIRFETSEEEGTTVTITIPNTIS
jgi:signal transduction histidine kinase